MKVPAIQNSSTIISQELLDTLAYNEKMAELGRISAGVVHELNAPLSVIVSAAQMIMREEDLPELVLELIARISSEALRLSQMTRGLLSFSSHNNVGEVSDVCLTMDFVLKFIRHEADRRGVTIAKNLNYQLPVIRVPSNILKQIALNIIMNALQAMEGCGGGTILIETTDTADGFVSIIISDTGPGIPPGLLPRIFEPYFTTKQQGEGTGLGLFVTRTLIDNLGGSLDVSSTVGKGTVFTISVPTEESV